MRTASKGETQETYESNLIYLPEWIRKAVGSIDEQELWDRIEVSYNGEGLPVCSYRDGDKNFQITSEEPVNEAKRWWKAVAEADGAGAVFLYGCGFGYPIFEIFERKKVHTFVAVFEQDLFLFKAMLYYFDLQPIFETGKIVFFIGDFDNFSAEFDRVFYSVRLVNSTYPVTAFTNAARRNFKERYIKIHRDVFSKLSMIIFNMGNDHKDNLIGFVNIMANVKEVLENPLISCLKDKYMGYPAFIIANGPSLDKNIRYLSEIRGRGIIICVESAIKPMLKNNIKPDILTVIERIKASYDFHFKDIDYPDDISLFSLALADPRIFSSFPGERIPIFRDREALNLWTVMRLGGGSIIDAGANVSHLAMEIALYLGADPIIFVGQDYAYGQGEATHSKDSIYSEEKGKQAEGLIQSIPKVYVEGNNGGRIRSNELWMEFRKGLELKISQHPDKKFINATEGGARIAGMRCEKLRDVIKKYCRNEIPARVNEFIREKRAEISVAKRKGGLEELIKGIETNMREFRETAGELKKGRIETVNLIRLVRRNNNGEFDQILEEGYQNNIAILNRLLSKQMLMCFSQQLIIANYYLINRLKMIDTPEKKTEVFKIHFNFMSSLEAVCQSASVHFENALATLKSTLEDINNMEGGR